MGEKKQLWQNMLWRGKIYAPNPAVRHIFFFVVAGGSQWLSATLLLLLCHTG
jgi:hypothetical protein